MARKKELTLQEKNEIVKKLAQGWSTLEISKKIGRDNRTVKKIAEVGIQPRKRRHQREFRNLNARDLSRLKRQMIKTPNLSSKSIFEACGLENVGRTTRLAVHFRIDCPCRLERNSSSRAEYGRVEEYISNKLVGR